MIRRLVPSRAMTVALFAVFLNLTGVVYAATGGTFFLGQANTANQTTALTGSPPSGAALAVTNATSGQPAASFTVLGKKAPFTVSSTGRVSKLNADRLDGIDSTGFVQGGARSGASRLALTTQNNAQTGTVATIPGFGQINVFCLGDQAGDADATLQYQNSSGQDEDVTYDAAYFAETPVSDPPLAQLVEQVVPNTGSISTAKAIAGSPDQHDAVLRVEFEIGSGLSHLATVWASASMAHGSPTCVAQAQWLATTQ